MVRFWGVFWVDVSKHATAEENFSEIAEVLGCPKTIDAVQRTLSNLPSSSRWLLVLDNADDPETDYTAYLPSGNRGAILITSRNPQCIDLADDGGHAELDSLEESECIQLLRRTARLHKTSEDPKDYAMSVSLVRHLGHHTLAILQAGSYIATTHCSMTEYLEYMHRNRRRLLGRCRGQGRSRYNTVYATFEASMEYLELSETGASEETSKDCLELLKILSTFNFMSVPLDVLVDTWEGTKKAVTTPETSEMHSHVLTAWHSARLPDFVRTEKDDVRFRITEAVARLESLALVRTDSSARVWKSVSMHPLVHTWAGDRQSQEERKEAFRMTTYIVALSYFSFEGWRPYYHQFAPHLKLVVESDAELVNDAARARCVVQACVQIAWMYHWMGLDKDMHEFTMSIFQRLRLHDEQPTDEFCELYRVYAIAARFGGYSMKAVRIFEAIARFDEATTDENDPARLKNLRDLASSYRDNMQAGKAQVLLEKVVKAYSERRKEDKDLLAAENDLAVAYVERGQVNEAIELLRKVERLGQRLLPPDNPNRLISEHELALAYLRGGQIVKATPLLEELAQIQAETYGLEHLETTTTQDSLATAYNLAGRSSEAIALWDRVIDTQTLIFGPHHSSVWETRRKRYEASGLREATSSSKKNLIYIGMWPYKGFNARLDELCAQMARRPFPISG